VPEHGVNPAVFAWTIPHFLLEESRKIKLIRKSKLAGNLLNCVPGQEQAK
jgi:hypothetical protein